MIWFQKSLLLKAAYAEIEQLRQQVDSERAGRLSAETIAVERMKELARVQEQALRFEQAYVESVHERLQSLDTVNVMLMREAAPQAQREESQSSEDAKKIEIHVKHQQSRMSRMRGNAIKKGLLDLAKSTQPKETVQ